MSEKEECSCDCFLNTYGQTILCESCIKEQMSDPMIPVAELREWCEVGLKNLSVIRNMEYHYFKRFSEKLLARFCKEAGDE